MAGRRRGVDIRAIGGSYRGTLGPSGEIAGELAQQYVKLALTFKRVAEAR